MQNTILPFLIWSTLFKLFKLWSTNGYMDQFEPQVHNFEMFGTVSSTELRLGKN